MSSSQLHTRAPGLAADEQRAFQAALAHHEAGRISEAAALYRALLARDPDHAGSLHLLGLIGAQQGDAETAIVMIRRAMALAPGQAPHHNSLALALRRLGRSEEALREYRTAAALRPGSAEIHNNLATSLLERGQRDEAVIHYRKAADCAPAVAEIWFNLANALAETGPAAEIEAAFRRAIALRPAYADARANFGRWLMTEARWAEAETQLAEATRLAPAAAPVWCNLAVTQAERGRADEAEAAYRQALALDPGFAAASYNLGCLLLGQGRTDQALHCQAAAIAADPLCGAARLAFCMAQLPIVYASQAEVALRRQRYAAALTELAVSSRAPDAAAALADAIGTSQPFFLAYQGEDDRALQASYGELACRVLAGARPAPALAPRPRVGERIRLGIVSGFFCDHTLFRLFLEGWLTHLDRDRFEVTGFHTGRVADAQTAWAAAHCDRFVQGLASGAAWQQAISAIQPHALLYPEVGIDPMAARLAAQRLAPVQCVTWGHPDTTGMPTVDYFLTSALMEPPEADAHYNERLVRLPNLGLCYQPADPPARRLSREALGLAPEGPVYWSGQALYKYLPRYDAIFPRIAAAVGACQFVFIGFARSHAVTEAFRARLGAAFAASGLEAERYCVFLPPMPQDRFVAAVGVADVVLDTPGWSGGKSTLDCLAQDPAIVTWPGRFMRGRHTAAILRRIGCTTTIAGSEDEYVSIAARLGLDPAWRAEVRQAVAQGKGPAFGDLEYVRGLEGFLAEAVGGCPR
jgi:predicted O-linked N-acetylglucosamine transferase (SPINDLY family)